MADDECPIYGECGGLMYLADGLTTDDGLRHEMCGLLPLEVRMAERLSLNYAAVTVAGDSSFFPAGATARGHVFHQSELVEPPSDPSISAAYRASVVGGESVDDGFGRGSVLASYIHIHFGSNPGLAEAFVEAARSNQG